MFRYYAVIYPLKYPSFVTSCRILCIIVCVWLIAALISLPPLFGFWSIYQFSAAQMGCLPLWRLNKSFSVFWVSISLLKINIYRRIFLPVWLCFLHIFFLTVFKFIKTRWVSCAMKDSWVLLYIHHFYIALYKAFDNFISQVCIWLFDIIFALKLAVLSCVKNYGRRTENDIEVF